MKLLCTVIAAAFLISACAPAATPTPPVAASPIETETVIKVQPEADGCFACHTDKQRLIDTAKPEEVVEKESTGAG